VLFVFGLVACKDTKKEGEETKAAVEEDVKELKFGFN
jgi:hypothetical protein